VLSPFIANDEHQYSKPLTVNNLKTDISNRPTVYTNVYGPMNQSNLAEFMNKIADYFNEAT